MNIIILRLWGFLSIRGAGRRLTKSLHIFFGMDKRLLEDFVVKCNQ